MQNNQAITDYLSDDLNFLIACCQTKPSEEDINFIHSYLSLITNYHLPITTAMQHGILPLVYQTLKNLSQNDSLPATHPLALPNHQLPITNYPSICSQT